MNWCKVAVVLYFVLCVRVFLALGGMDLRGATDRIFRRDRTTTTLRV